MAPSGVRAPQRAMPAMGGRPATAGEPYGEEAYLWTREHFNQREVGGSCGGTLRMMTRTYFDGERGERDPLKSA